MSTPHDDYKRLETPADTHLEHCPVCGHAAELWQYSASDDGPTNKLICCTRGDAFGPQEGEAMGGCLLYLPPQPFYRATIREAARYWNDYAKALEKLRRAKHWETARVLRSNGAEVDDAESAPHGTGGVSNG
jgi:hypothetical protein